MRFLFLNAEPFGPYYHDAVKIVFSCIEITTQCAQMSGDHVNRRPENVVGTILLRNTRFVIEVREKYYDGGVNKKRDERYSKFNNVSFVEKKANFYDNEKNSRFRAANQRRNAGLSDSIKKKTRIPSVLKTRFESLLSSAR